MPCVPRYHAANDDSDGVSAPVLCGMYLKIIEMGVLLVFRITAPNAGKNRKKECPTCRVHCSSRRHLRPDPNFDALISAIYPNLDEYEAQEGSHLKQDWFYAQAYLETESFIAGINRSLNRKALTESVEKGIRRQAAASYRTKIKKKHVEGNLQQQKKPQRVRTRTPKRKKSEGIRAASHTERLTKYSQNSRFPSRLSTIVHLAL